MLPGSPKFSPSGTYDFLFKFLIIGDTCVGKSCLLTSFTKNSFSKEHDATVGVEFGSRYIHIDAYKIKVQIWDTAGQEKFDILAKTYYKGTHVTLIVYDVTDRNSFTNVENWLNRARENASESIVTILVGNKIDLASKRVITQKEGELLAFNQGIDGFIETSAKDGTNIEKSFEFGCRSLLKKVRDSPRSKFYGSKEASRELGSPCSRRNINGEYENKENGNKRYFEHDNGDVSSEISEEQEETCSQDLTTKRNLYNSSIEPYECSDPESEKDPLIKKQNDGKGESFLQFCCCNCSIL